MAELRGKFITFEGPEGSGKTTQIALLKQYLSRKKCSVITTREPGGEKAAEKIRHILLSPKYSLKPLTELFLYAASRLQHVEKIIKPALRKGKVVLCDRFCDATLAYQGYGRGISKEFIKKINRITTSGLKPHLTIVLDIETGIGLKKARHIRKFSNSIDRMEKEPLSFHRRVRSGYLKLARQEPGRIKVVNVRKEIKQTQAKIREIVSNVIQ